VPCFTIWVSSAFTGNYRARRVASLEVDLETLSTQFKEFNLDCVSCHVTGYGKPGGSTVTFNGTLQNVQCEECNGPGSLHAKSPKKKDLIVAKPSTDVCLACHHPPHVEAFDAKEKMKLVLGKGHGLP